MSIIERHPHFLEWARAGKLSFDYLTDEELEQLELEFQQADRTETREHD